MIRGVESATDHALQEMEKWRETRRHFRTQQNNNKYQHSLYLCVGIADAYVPISEITDKIEPLVDFRACG